MDYCKNCKRWTCGAQGTSHEMFIPCGNYIPPTNADKIRAMKDDDLGQMFAAITSCGRCPLTDCDGGHNNCTDYWLDWLKQEVGDGDA